MTLVKSDWGHRVWWFQAHSYLLKAVWERTEQVGSASRMRRCLLIHCCSATWPFTKARSRGRSFIATSRDRWRCGHTHAQITALESNQHESACLCRDVKRWLSDRFSFLSRTQQTRSHHMDSLILYYRYFIDPWGNFVYPAANPSS